MSVTIQEIEQVCNGCRYSRLSVVPSDYRLEKDSRDIWCSNTFIERPKLQVEAVIARAQRRCEGFTKSSDIFPLIQSS